MNEHQKQFILRLMQNHRKKKYPSCSKATLVKMMDWMYNPEVTKNQWNILKHSFAVGTFKFKYVLLV